MQAAALLKDCASCVHFRRGTCSVGAAATCKGQFFFDVAEAKKRVAQRFAKAPPLTVRFERRTRSRLPRHKGDDDDDELLWD